MDVLVLIDKLDDLVHNAKPVPLTDQVRVDKEEIYDILDQMRATIPEEIKQARWIVKERQEMLAEAKREQDRLLQEAREQAVREASQTEIVKLAERQAQEIIDEARRQAREMRLEMEDWAEGMLAAWNAFLLQIYGDNLVATGTKGRYCAPDIAMFAQRVYQLANMWLEEVRKAQASAAYRFRFDVPHPLPHWEAYRSAEQLRA